MNNQLVLFDYDQLDSETRITLKQRADRINERTRRMAQDIWENGREFYEAQQELAKHGYGCFREWAETETGFSHQTVYNFIRVYQNFDCKTVLQSKMAARALYLLAAPSTPDEARHEAISRAEQGEQITHATAKQILSSYKPNGNGAQPEVPEDNRPLFAPDPDLDSSLADEGQPVCQNCGQVYDGQECPDCRPAFNYKRDNKANREGNIYTPQGYDACQTPAYALDPLFPYLHDDWIIWEPAAGEGYLAEGLYDGGYRTSQVIRTDLLNGTNFFEYEPESWDCLVTNPPYSIKYQWLERCYQLGKPFALLMPVETLGAKTAQLLFKKYGGGVIFLDKRINFKMPNKGWDSSAQFPVAWFTWKLNLGQSYQVAFGEVTRANELVS